MCEFVLCEGGVEIWCVKVVCEGVLCRWRFLKVVCEGDV